MHNICQHLFSATTTHLITILFELIVMVMQESYIVQLCYIVFTSLYTAELLHYIHTRKNIPLWKLEETFAHHLAAGSSLWLSHQHLHH